MSRRAFLLALVAGAALLLPGCGGPKMAPVEGRVMWKGKPIKEASVTFNPVPKDDKDREPGKPATGFTDEDGRFVLSTYRPRDGALVGPHDVVIALDETNPAKAKRTTKLTKEVTDGKNEITIEIE